ncbi:MAG: hypothetical protein IJV80_00220, partial [Clostridia bacterium]|nr:hypothetical protein [Clostridia bacterium]
HNLEQYHAQLSQRAQELQRREDELALAEKHQAANASVPTTPLSYFAPEQREVPAQAERSVNFDDLLKRASEDGIRLKTAGSMRTALPQKQTTETSAANGLFNKGLALFKSACFIFAIILAESLSVFFLRDYLGLHIAYPVIALAVGLVMIGVIGTMYAFGYQANARRAKNPSYGTTASILFVIAVLITAMVSVYCKADLANVKSLLTFVVIPVIYLANILFFAGFYHLFSRADKRKL